MSIIRRYINIVQQKIGFNCAFELLLCKISTFKIYFVHKLIIPSINVELNFNESCRHIFALKILFICLNDLNIRFSKRVYG